MSKRDVITRPDREKEARSTEGGAAHRVLVVSTNPLKRATWCRTCSVLGALPTPLDDLRTALQLVGEGPPRAVMVLFDDTGADPDPEGTNEGIDALLEFDSSRVARVLRVVRGRGAPPPMRSRVTFLPMPVTEADLYPLLSARPITTRPPAGPLEGGGSTER